MKRVRAEISADRKKVSNMVNELGKGLQTGLKRLENLEHKQTDLSTKFVDLEKGVERI